MGKHAIRNLVNLKCQRCNKEFLAKRKDTKWCPSCREIVKAINTAKSERRNKVHRNASQRARNAKLTPEQRQKRLEYQRKRRWEKDYGLSIENYYQMLNDQQGKCKICKELMSLPQIDHCHRTGKVRGLLCQKCNHGIGLFGDKIDLLNEAINYLK